MCLWRGLDKNDRKQMKNNAKFPQSLRAGKESNKRHTILVTSHLLQLTYRRQRIRERLISTSNFWPRGGGGGGARALQPPAPPPPPPPPPPHTHTHTFFESFKEWLRKSAFRPPLLPPLWVTSQPLHFYNSTAVSKLAMFRCRQHCIAGCGETCPV